MSQKNDLFSTQKISPQLVSQVIDAIRNKAYGSVEIYISNYKVTQITERVINKVSNPKSNGSVEGTQNGLVAGNAFDD